MGEPTHVGDLVLPVLAEIAETAMARDRHAPSSMTKEEIPSTGSATMDERMDTRTRKPAPRKGFSNS
jgi:hypothetical protein